MPCVWVSAEAFLAYKRANRRILIGLCDRAVANRYLLYGISGAFQVFACTTDIFVDTAEEVSSTLDFALGAFEFPGIAALLLLFFQPTFYRRWISADAIPAEGTVKS